MLVADEWELVQSILSRAGVSGFADFGRFVNNTEYFQASQFDEQSAMPVLMGLLPSLTDKRSSPPSPGISGDRGRADGLSGASRCVQEVGTEGARRGSSLGSGRCTGDSCNCR